MLKGKTDSAASTAQPQDQKSYTQQAGDAISGNQNENSGSLMDSAKVWRLSSKQLRVLTKCIGRHGYAEVENGDGLIT